MRRRSLAIFFAGFAAGMLFLAVVIFRQAPRMRTTHASSAAAPRAPAKQAMSVSPLPPVQAGLVIPVQGVTANGLRDDFEEMREGHRHEAIDIPAARGTPVLAVAEGNVAKLFQSKQGGLTVYQFDDGQAWCYYYAHLDHYVKGLSEGALLRAGDVLGYVGTTGDAPPQTPHLHFAIFKLGPEKRWWQGTAIDPYLLLTGQGTRLP